jgi:hypothetical protein
MSCKHKRGDFFHGMWICADCFTPLDERPKAHTAGGVLDGKPQEIKWIASIATDADGTKFSTFLKWMTGYLRWRSLFTMTKDSARLQCLEALRDIGEPFGSAGFSWERSDAREIVREEIISHWEAPASGANT